MKKSRPSIPLGVGCVAVAALGSLYAAGLGMGFKLNLLLEEQTPGVSATGQTQIGLPYNPQSGIVTVRDLYDGINSAGGTPSSSCNPEVDCAVVAVSRFVRLDDSKQTYTGGVGANTEIYPIDGVEGQRVQVRNRVNYIVVGSHDPGRVVTLYTQRDDFSYSGQNEISLPYHGMATRASELRDEINAFSTSGDAVSAISWFRKSDDVFVTYTGGAADLSLDFPITPGESYRIQVSEDVAYVPLHY